MILGLDAYLTDWLDLLFRWLHVIAGIVWIGTSFYFVALDNHLPPRASRATGTPGVGGELWEIHGGGFYRVQKYRVAPETLPEPLHWFKWEAYTTWLTGFALLVVLYYSRRRHVPDRPGVADLERGRGDRDQPRAARARLARLRRALPAARPARARARASQASRS